jgi:hypothetical protein
VRRLNASCVAEHLVFERADVADVAAAAVGEQTLSALVVHTQAEEAALRAEGAVVLRLENNASAEWRRPATSDQLAPGCLGRLADLAQSGDLLLRNVLSIFLGNRKVYADVASMAADFDTNGGDAGDGLYSLCGAQYTSAGVYLPAGRDAPAVELRVQKRRRDE